MSGDRYRDKVLEVEPYGVAPIPENERHGKPAQMFTIWFAINLNIVTWFTGFWGPVFGLSVPWAIAAIVIGNLAGAAFLALSSSIGPLLGQSLIPASKKAFGKGGVVFLSVLNLVNNIGWLGVNLLLAVMAFQKIVPLGYHASIAILAGITLLVAIFGYNFIHKFAHWMSIGMGILFAFISIITIINLPHIAAAQPAAAGGFDPGLFILTISVVFSYQISYSPIGTDYARYLPENTSKRKLWRHSFLGALIACVWLEVLGALTASLGTQVAPIDFIAQIMGPFTMPALIVVILSILPVNAMAMYSGGLATLAMGLPLKRWISAVCIAVFGAVLIMFDRGRLTEQYTNFLLLLSYWIVPWFCVMYYDSWSRGIRKGGGLVSNGWLGLVSFLGGILLSVPFMHSNLYVGILAKNFLGGADISYFVSAIVSVAIYSFSLRVSSSSARKLANP